AWRAVAGDGPVEEHATIAGSGGDEVLAAGVGIADALPAGHWGAVHLHVGWVVGHARHRIAVANQVVLGLPQRHTVPAIPGGRHSVQAQADEVAGDGYARGAVDGDAMAAGANESQRAEGRTARSVDETQTVKVVEIDLDHRRPDEAWGG